MTSLDFTSLGLAGTETLNELCLALAHTTYGRTLAYFISDKARSSYRYVGWT